ncbi:hypothetical protein LCGC14_2402940 [marine sediment metagenome]|uniref:Uncharacterized protein n=1 Tax=marine sediment metagenome TaxID=412755 RepID=A0A0F9BUR0_9ZZZZ
METDHAREQAQAQLESITGMVEAMNADREWGGMGAHEAILEDALSVEVRSGWHAPEAPHHPPLEYCLLLCTGGPAVRIRGDLDSYGTPASVILEYQDWGTPWTVYPATGAEDAIMLVYAMQFYFGD